MSFLASFVEAYSASHNKGFNCTCCRLSWYGLYLFFLNTRPGIGRKRMCLLKTGEGEPTSCFILLYSHKEVLHLKTNLLLWSRWERDTLFLDRLGCFLPTGTQTCLRYCTPTMGKHANTASHCSVWYSTHCWRGHKRRRMIGVFDSELIKP